MRFLFLIVGTYLLLLLALATFVAFTSSLLTATVPQRNSNAASHVGGKTLPKGLSLSMPYVRLAWNDAVQVGIAPATFVRQIQQESGFNPHALSPAGAEGIAQFLPGTAATLGIDPWNPVSALAGAAHYMATLSQSYQGDTAKALAAYNAGSAAVNACVQRLQAAWLSCLPLETRQYVHLILSSYNRRDLKGVRHMIDHLPPVLATLAQLQAPPPADTSGVGNAFINLARLGASMLGGVIAFFSVICGFQYIAAMDDASKAMHAKRAIGFLLIGAIIVAVGVGFAPQIVKAIFP